MVKEELLDVRRHAAVPRAHAPTPSPTRSPTPRRDLYEEVTDYVREEMNRADSLRRQAGSGTRRLRAHRPAAPARLHRPRRSTSRSGAAASGSRRRLREEQLARRGGGVDPTVDAPSRRSPTTIDDSTNRRRSELEELEESVVDPATAAQTDRGARGRDRHSSSSLEAARAARARSRAPTASGPSCRELLQDNRRDARRRRAAAASSSSSPSTATRSNYLTREIRDAARPPRGRRRRSTAASRRERAPEGTGAVHARPRRPGPASPPTPPARASTSSAPT